MEIDFWQQRWDLNQIAFHLPTVNPYLESFFKDFNTNTSSQIFIPLCGKSLDIIWLASHNYSVLGVECSEKAIRELFLEQNLKPKKNNIENFEVYQTENIQILQGDYFKLNEYLLKDVSLVYDRASLIALPVDMRKNYVDLLKRSLPDSAEILLITLEYDQKIMHGPPFSVSNNEVSQLYQDKYNIQMLHELDVLKTHQNFKQRGLNKLIERVYKINAK